jgi:hypothetical protein
MSNGKDGITAKSVMINLGVIVLGYVVWHAAAILLSIIISLLSQIKIIGPIFLWLAGAGGGYGLGAVTIASLGSGFAMLLVTGWLMDKSAQKQYRWGYIALATILIIEQIFNYLFYNAGESLWLPITTIFFIVMFTQMGVKEAAK